MFNYKYLTREHLKGFDNYKVKLAYVKNVFT